MSSPPDLSSLLGAFMRPSGDNGALLALLRSMNDNGDAERKLLSSCPKIFRIIRKNKYDTEESFLAALRKHPETLKEINHCNARVGTPLLYAIIRIEVPVWKAMVLVDLGADVNRACTLTSLGYKYAIAPLMAALILPRLSMAKMLHAAGASFDTQLKMKLPAFSSKKIGADGESSFDKEKVVVNPIVAMIAYSAACERYGPSGAGYTNDQDPTIRVEWVLDNAPAELIKSWDLNRLGSNRGVLSAVVYRKWFTLAIRLSKLEQVDMKFVCPSMEMNALGVATYLDCNDLLSVWLELPEERRGVTDTLVGGKPVIQHSNVNTKRNVEDYKVMTRRASAVGSTTAAASSSTPTPCD
jgi:hypothetical protein